MKDRNQIQLIGYVGTDPHVKLFENGNKRVRIMLATHAPMHRKSDAEVVEYSTTWHTIIAWDKAAEYAANNFLKGSHILIDGRVIYRSFENKFGVKKTVTEIIAYSLINLDR
jgi:single-strand DNA-binding protein